MGAEDPSRRRVVLFGSTVPGRPYRRESDIDLAVEGGDHARLERLAADVARPVDVIRLDELRSFRHLFRTLYAQPLDPDRTRLVQSKVDPAVNAFEDAHREFAAKLEQIAAALDRADDG